MLMGFESTFSTMIARYDEILIYFHIRILAKMLKLDRSTYNYTDKTTIPKHVSVFQQAIDDSL